MALEALIPFWSARLTLVGGRRLLTAPRHPEIAWMDASPETLADHFGRTSRDSWSRDGELIPWLEAAPPVSLAAETLLLELSPPKASTLPSPLPLRFDVAIGPGPSERWLGYVPALGVGASGEDEEQVRENLRAAIRLEFLRSKRLEDARQVLSVQWFEQVELLQREARATFYTFSELRAFREAEKEKQLPSVAVPLRPSRQRIFAVDGPVAELARAVGSPYTRNILLVGPAGVGKSAVVEELARRRAPLDGKTIWETAAARMERVLTDTNGWQDNLSQVCRELTEQGDWLYVRNLAELYEVGRYVGNKVSMGEYLRPRLSGGEIGFISECTPEQKARIEARYPGSLDSFRVLTVEEPAHADLVTICQSRARAEAGKADVHAEAVDELIRLLKRFSPYSGFPGKPVRFLESLALSRRTGTAPIDREAILSRFCDETGMPRALIDPHQDLPAEAIEASFRERVFGQDSAISAIVEALVSVRAGLSRPKRPISTLLFVGPTGVGKTETAKALARFMFGSPDRMIRLDMSEYATPSAAIRLTEGPGGDGRLTSAIRREPFSVVLFDEIEKAHPMVFDLLLQVLGEGRLSDGRGRMADFCSSIIILTSNIGAAEASVAPSGFARGQERSRRLLEVYRAAAERHFRPEFFNRLDRVVAFAPLDQDAIGRVLARELRALEKRPGMRLRRASLSLTDAARDRLAALGYSPAWGARQLQRTLRTEASAIIAAALNAHPCPHPVDLTLDLEGEQIVCRLEERSPGKQALSAVARFEEVADQIDAARRVAQQIADGSRYAALLSELQYLTRREQRLKERFWQNTEHAARFGRLQGVAQDCRDMFAAISELSTESVLSAMEDEPVPGPFEEGLADYLSQATAAQRKLFDTLATDGMVVTIGVYGEPEPARDLAGRYDRLAQDLALRSRLRAVWLRKPPKERGIPDKLPDNKAEREAVIADRDQAYTVLRDDQEATSDCSRRVGYEVEVKGAGAVALLGAEEGVVSMEDTAPEVKLLVSVARVGWDEHDRRDLRPEDVHRRSATAHPPRRFVGRGRVHDKLLRETVQGTLTDFVRKVLQDRFPTLIIEDLTS